MAPEHRPQQDTALIYMNLYFPGKVNGTSMETPVLSPPISRGRWLKLPPMERGSR